MLKFYKYPSYHSRDNSTILIIMTKNNEKDYFYWSAIQTKVCPSKECRIKTENKNNNKVKKKQMQISVKGPEKNKQK